MFRCAGWLVLIFLVADSAFVAADDSPPPSRTGASAGRPRGERLQQLRERLATSKTDLSKLKRVTWKIGDLEREALVYVPETSSKEQPPPLIFAFHGHGGRAEYSARRFAFHELWPEAVCVYPLGLPTPVPLLDPEGKRSGWQKYVGDQADRDLKFFDAMFATMKLDHHIDPQRVYVAGHSNGGYFTYVLWAARGDELTAVAPVAAGLSIRDFKSQKPKPVLHVAGENDQIVRFGLQERTLQQIRDLNGCDATGKPAGQFCTEYSSEKGPPVVTYIHPGGHEIPDDAPKRIVEFFKQQTGQNERQK